MGGGLGGCGCRVDQAFGLLFLGFPWVDQVFVSIGSPLNLYGMYFGFLFDVCWISFGSLSDLYWISLGSLLDSCWISFGSPSDLYCISIGYLLDLYLISVGSLLVSLGYVLDLCRISIGSLSHYQRWSQRDSQTGAKAQHSKCQSTPRDMYLNWFVLDPNMCIHIYFYTYIRARTYKYIYM
jgi:hypothetical protein